MALFKAVVLAAVVAVSMGATLFEENFDSDPFASDRWVVSKWKGSDMGSWAWTAGEWYADAEKNKGIQTTQDMKHHAAATKIPTPFSNVGKPLVLQFTAKNEKKEYSFCGGGYIKLLPTGTDLSNFGGDDKYHIMFGPDLCGYDVSRIHLIFRDNADKNLLKKDDIKLDYDDKNEFTHLYTLVLNPDKTFQVFFDNKEKASGSLFDGWDFAPKTIDDPSDTKPADWVDEAEIDDPTDTKPEGWDDIPETIADPDSSKPEEWDEDLDGEWEAAMIPNPDYKGEWKAKRIPNPAYKGEWKPKQIDNPDFVETIAEYPDIGAVGFELWTVNNGTIFDNILITDSLEEAQKAAEGVFAATVEGEKAAKEAWQKAKDEAAKKDAPPAAAAAQDSDDEEVVEEAEAADELKKDEL